MQLVTELKSPPVVGKKYLVPCFSWNTHWNKAWFPIIGEFHADPDLGVSDEHIHYDSRFLSDRQIDSLTNKKPELYSREILVLGSVIWQPKHKGFLVENRIKLCRREMQVFPLVFQQRYTDLHTKFDGKKVKCGKCPHRGFPIGNLPVDDLGYVICNGHGLKINTRTDRVESRFEV
jgi:hypothetical protein